MGIWAAFLSWTRTSHVWRAGSKLTGDVVLGMWAWFIIWLSERWFHYLFPEPAQEPMIYDRLPYRYLFDTLKVGVLSAIVVWGIIDTWRELSRRRR
jgi:hypothetical protein